MAKRAYGGADNPRALCKFRFSAAYSVANRGRRSSSLKCAPGLCFYPHSPLSTLLSTQYQSAQSSTVCPSASSCPPTRWPAALLRSLFRPSVLFLSNESRSEGSTVRGASFRIPCHFYPSTCHLTPPSTSSANTLTHTCKAEQPRLSFNSNTFPHPKKICLGCLAAPFDKSLFLSLSFLPFQLRLIRSLTLHNALLQASSHPVTIGPRLSPASLAQAP